MKAAGRSWLCAATAAGRRAASREAARARKPVFLLLVVIGLLQACAPHAVQTPTVAVEHLNHARVQRIAFDPSGRRLASGDLHGRVNIWSVSDGRLLQSLGYHRHAITGLAWLDDERLISADSSGLLLLSRTDSAAVLKEVRMDALSALALAPDRTWIVTSEHRAIHKLSLPDLEPEARLAIRLPALAIAINHAGDRIAMSDSGGTVQLLDTSLSPVLVLPRASRNAYALAFSPDDSVLAGGGWFRLLAWDVRTRRLGEYSTPHLGKINSVAISPDGSYWLSLGRETDSQLLMTDAITHRVERYFQPHELCGDQVLFSPDGRFAASSSDDGSVYIYDLKATYRPVILYPEP